MMKDKDEVWNAFVDLYNARDAMDAAIRKAMDVLFEAEGNKWEAGFVAAESLFEDEMYRLNLQTVIDALEELSDTGQSND